MLPPTPKPATASSDASVTKSCAPPAARPNTPVMSKVRLNDHLKRGAYTILELPGHACDFDEPPTPDVAAKRPEDSADEEAHVQREGEEGRAEGELAQDGAQDETGDELGFA